MKLIALTLTLVVLLSALAACSSPVPDLSEEEKINIVRTWMLENCQSGKLEPGELKYAAWRDQNGEVKRGVRVFPDGSRTYRGVFTVDPVTHKVTVLEGEGEWCKD